MVVAARFAIVQWRCLWTNAAISRNGTSMASTNGLNTSSPLRRNSSCPSSEFAMQSVVMMCIVRNNVQNHSGWSSRQLVVRLFQSCNVIRPVVMIMSAIRSVNCPAALIWRHNLRKPWNATDSVALTVNAIICAPNQWRRSSWNARPSWNVRAAMRNAMTSVAIVTAPRLVCGSSSESMALATMVTSTITMTVTSTITMIPISTITMMVTSTITVMVTSTITMMVTSTITMTVTSTITMMVTSTITMMVTSTITMMVTSTITMMVTSTITMMVTSTITMMVTSTITMMVTSTITMMVTSTITMMVTSTITIMVTSTITMMLTSTITMMLTSTITMMVTSTTMAHNQWLIQSHLWFQLCQHCQSLSQLPRRPSPVPRNVDGTQVVGTGAKEIGWHCASIATRWRRSWCAIRSVSMTTCATRIALVQKIHGSKKRWRHRWAATMSVVMTASATTSANALSPRWRRSVFLGDDSWLLRPSNLTWGHIAASTYGCSVDDSPVLGVNFRFHICLPGCNIFFLEYIAVNGEFVVKFGGLLWEFWEVGKPQMITNKSWEL